MCRWRALVVLAGLALAVPAAGDTRVADKRGAELAPPGFGAPAPALVTIDVFCDFTSTHSVRVLAEAVELVAKHPRDTRVIVRVLPHRNPFAVKFAELSWEAQEQGRWAAYLEVMTAARQSDKRDLSVLAGLAGLDVARAERALASGRHLERVARDVAWAGQQGIYTATGVTLNGVAIVPGADAWEVAWRDAASRARAELARGTSPLRVYHRLARADLRRRAELAWRHGLETDEHLRARVNVPVEGAPALSAPAASALVVVFGDYTGEPARSLARLLLDLDAEYAGRLRIVWKHAPGGLPDARAAARAAACAQLQDRFWDLHRRMLTYRYRLDREHLEELAVASGLELQRFNDDFDGGVCEARVEEDLADAEALGVAPGAAALFVNGRRVPGPIASDRTGLRAILDDELAPGLLAELAP